MTEILGELMRKKKKHSEFCFSQNVVSNRKQQKYHLHQDKINIYPPTTKPIEQ